jgi:multiple sugar transport system permease protein
VLSGKKMNTLRRKDLQLAIALVLPAFLIMGVVTIYPLISSFSISLRQWDLMRPDIGRPFVGLDNYRFILSDPIFWESVSVTLLFVFLAVTFEITLGFLIAMMLNRPFRGRTAVRLLALLPWAVPSVVNGIMWKWILNPSYGAANGLLYELGIIDQYIVWLGEPKLALFMVVWADVWKETSFIMLLFLAALQTIPTDLYEAARVDGANGLQRLFRITIPLIRPTLIYTLTAGGPSNGTAVLGYYTYLKSFVSLQLGRGAAAAYIMTAAVMIVVVFYQRAIYRGVEY